MGWALGSLPACFARWPELLAALVAVCLCVRSCLAVVPVVGGCRPLRGGISAPGYLSSGSNGQCLVQLLVCK